jgi:hypothetical protein
MKNKEEILLISRYLVEDGNNLTTEVDINKTNKLGFHLMIK